MDTITTFLQGDVSLDDDDTKRITTKTVLNRLSTLRRRLGCDEDGVELLPTSKGGRQAGGQAAVGRYTVSPRVMTDVELLEHRYQTSLGLTSQEALIVLRDGLELMGGPAFRARKGYSWASGEGVQGKLACIINTYAARLMELAFEADDLPLVLETCRWAGRVIDDAVLELPMLRRQAAYAEASGDSALCKAVSEAKRRLRDYTDDTDSGFDPG